MSANLWLVPDTRPALRLLKHAFSKKPHKLFVGHTEYFGVEIFVMLTKTGRRPFYLRWRFRQNKRGIFIVVASYFWMLQLYKMVTVLQLTVLIQVLTIAYYSRRYAIRLHHLHHFFSAKVPGPAGYQVIQLGLIFLAP